jgi:hypothetical protein
MPHGMRENFGVVGPTKPDQETTPDCSELCLVPVCSQSMSACPLRCFTHFLVLVYSGAFPHLYCWACFGIMHAKTALRVMNVFSLVDSDVSSPLRPVNEPLLSRALGALFQCAALGHRSGIPHAWAALYSDSMLLHNRLAKVIHTCTSVQCVRFNWHSHAFMRVFNMRNDL